MFWNRLTLVMALGKAAIAGAGVAIALLGVFDAALAATVTEWWESFEHVRALDIVASFGAVGGIIARLVFG